MMIETVLELAQTDCKTIEEDIPNEWQCPICFVGKDDFEPIEA